MDLIFGDVHYRLGFGTHNGFLGIAGNLCGQNAQRLGHAFRKTAKHLKGCLFVSLDGLKTLDSAALNLFVAEKQALRQRQCDLVFVDVPAQIQSMLEAAHLTTVFEILPTLQEAEAKYGHALT